MFPVYTHLIEVAFKGIFFILSSCEICFSYLEEQASHAFVIFRQFKHKNAPKNIIFIDSIHSNQQKDRIFIYHTTANVKASITSELACF